MLRLLAFTLALVSSAGAVTLTSPDIQDGGVISAEHIYPRCGGQNISPALSWSGVPAGAKSLALTMIDVSKAPSGWSHWIRLDVPASSTGLAKGTEAGRGVKSNFGEDHYDGPCPPKGTGLHRYVITLWVLKGPSPALTADEPADQVTAALQAASMDKASITGTVMAP
jgi:Raf kinase inhibitor-like YbhB/YbcL family protein